jgi:hypothetical protein
MPVVRLTLALALFIAVLSLAPTSRALPNTIRSAAPYGNCPPPATAGVHVCTPNIAPGWSIASPMQVIASATGADGVVNHIELWADGKKITQNNGSLFDKPVSLPSGSHRVTLVEVDSAGAFAKSTPFTVTIEGSTLANQCSAPASAGVHVCFPAPGSCHTAPWTTVVATGTGASGTVAHMELWVNGVKLANFPGKSINTNLYLPDYDKMTVVEVDSKGAYVKSVPITLLSC